LVYVRYCLDGRGLKLEDTVAAVPVGGPSKEQQQKQQQQQRRKQQIQKQQQRKETSKTKKLPPTTKSKSSFSSMLRTATTHTNPQHKKPTTNKSTSNATETITSGDVIKNLRTTIEQQLTKFDNDPLTTSLKLPISLSTHTKNLSDVEKEKVGMEIIKFLVYEQVDECGGEEKGWVSHKEAGEFMDEAVFAVYKKGCVPVDVMEDMMKGDLPDEQKQEQRAMREAAAKEEDRKARKAGELNLKNATRYQVDIGVDMKSLNSTKRDRRSIEAIQRDMGGDGGSKRARN